MPILNIVLDCVKYKYKTNLCSAGTFLVFIATIIVIGLPIIIIESTGGFWRNIIIDTEFPDVMFKNKYLLIAESRYSDEPVICSTMPNHMDNRLPDHCGITKVQEVDSNQDGLNDVLKFELGFYVKFPVHSLRLYLFFNYEFKEQTNLAMETMATLLQPVPIDVQKIYIFGDLKFKQRRSLQNHGIYNIYNFSTDIADDSLLQLITEHFGRAFSAEIENNQLTWQTGFSPEEEVIVNVELVYSENLVYYRPQFWQDLKWAWVQYFAFFLIFVYIGQYIVNYIFSNGYVQSYVILPWKDT